MTTQPQSLPAHPKNKCINSWNTSNPKIPNNPFNHPRLQVTSSYQQILDGLGHSSVHDPLNNLTWLMTAMPSCGSSNKSTSLQHFYVHRRYFLRLAQRPVFRAFHPPRNPEALSQSSQVSAVHSYAGSVITTWPFSWARKFPCVRFADRYLPNDTTRKICSSATFD